MTAMTVNECDGAMHSVKVNFTSKEHEFCVLPQTATTD